MNEPSSTNRKTKEPTDPHQRKVLRSVCLLALILLSALLIRGCQTALERASEAKYYHSVNEYLSRIQKIGKDMPGEQYIVSILHNARKTEPSRFSLDSHHTYIIVHFEDVVSVVLDDSIENISARKRAALVKSYDRRLKSELKQLEIDLWDDPFRKQKYLYSFNIPVGDRIYEPHFDNEIRFETRHLILGTDSSPDGYYEYPR